MNIALVRLCGVAAIATGVTVGARIVTRPGEQAVRGRGPMTARIYKEEAGVDDSLLGLAIQKAPFRAARAPAAVAYDPDIDERAAVVAQAPPKPPKPRLVLTGVVWGATPLAIIEGVPGADAPRVFRKGEVVGPLTLTRIAPERVTVAGMDTTWVLSIQQAGATNQ